MKLLKHVLLIFMVFPFFSHAQEGKNSLGFSFLLNDFKTPSKIRSNSLASVINNKQGAKLKDMSAGIGVTYLRNLMPNLDLAVAGEGSFVNFAANGVSRTNDLFLLEVNAAAQFNLVPSNFCIQPYLTAGAGASMYGGSYFGAFVPLGAGLKFNLGDNSKIFVSSQYRVPVTESTNTYHLNYQIGFASSIGKK